MTDAAAHRAIDAAVRQRDLGRARILLRTLVEANQGDVDAWMKLATVARMAGDRTEALAAVDGALTAQPLFYLALLLKASLTYAQGRMTEAAELYAAALFHMPEDAARSPALQPQIAAARAAIAEHGRAARERVAAAVASQIGEISQAERVAVERFVANSVDRRPVFHQEPTHFRFPGLADIEFFDDYDPSLLARLAALTAAIRTEFEALISVNAREVLPYVNFAPGQPVGPWGELNKSAKWNALHLIRHGEVVETNARHCPLTVGFFREAPQPDLPGLAPNLMFSLLAPGAHIPPHHGVANTRAVLHLPLIVPEGCVFRVGGDTRPWQEGKPWVFDDTIEHEAWNTSERLRVVLIADIWRPELSDRERLLVRAAMKALPDTGVPETL